MRFCTRSWSRRGLFIGSSGLLSKLVCLLILFILCSRCACWWGWGMLMGLRVWLRWFGISRSAFRWMMGFLICFCCQLCWCGGSGAMIWFVGG